MELRQVVEPSQTASVLQAVASPEGYKQPVLSERCEGALVLPLASEGWSGAETIPAVSIITAAVCTDFYHLYPSLSPRHLFFILTSSSKGHQSVRYSQAEANEHQRPIGSALASVTSPGSNPRGRGQDLGKRRSGKAIKPLMNVVSCCLFFQHNWVRVSYLESFNP